MDLTEKTYLVTGAAGCVGKAVLSRLITIENVTTFGFVRKRPCYDVHQKFPYTPIVGDLNDRHLLVQACQEVDVIIHAAATVSSWGARTTFHTVNVEGTKHILDAAVQSSRLQCFVYIITIAVYGSTQGSEITEEACLRSDGWPYADTKEQQSRSRGPFQKDPRLSLT